MKPQAVSERDVSFLQVCRGDLLNTPGGLEVVTELPDLLVTFRGSVDGRLLRQHDDARGERRRDRQSGDEALSDHVFTPRARRGVNGVRREVVRWYSCSLFGVEAVCEWGFVFHALCD